MDKESESATKLLDTIGACTAEFRKKSSELSDRSEVLSTSSLFECRTLDYPGTTVSLYLEIELKTGISVTYSLELYWDINEWILTAQISKNDEDGYTKIVEYPEIRTGNYGDLLERLRSTSQVLLNNSMVEALFI